MRKTSQESADLGAEYNNYNLCLFFFNLFVFALHFSRLFRLLFTSIYESCFFFRVCKCTFVNEYKDCICKLLLSVHKTLTSFLRLLAGRTATWFGVHTESVFLVSLREGNKKCQCLQRHTHIPVHAQLSLFKCLSRVPEHF